jgi:hypothetical protein
MGSDFWYAQRKSMEKCERGALPSCDKQRALNFFFFLPMIRINWNSIETNILWVSTEYSPKIASVDGTHKLSHEQQFQSLPSHLDQVSAMQTD